MSKKDPKNPAQDLQGKLDSLEAKTLELDNSLKRALADYQNLERRLEKNKTEYVQFANQSLLDKFLPILDHLELAQNHLKDPGLQMVIENFYNVLLSEGIKEIPALHQTFDPNLMDCVEVVAGPKDQVTKVLTKGYLYHHKVLRPSKVEVGNGQSLIVDSKLKS